MVKVVTFLGGVAAVLGVLLVFVALGSRHNSGPEDIVAAGVVGGGLLFVLGATTVGGGLAASQGRRWGYLLVAAAGVAPFLLLLALSAGKSRGPAPLFFMPGLAVSVWATLRYVRP